MRGDSLTFDAVAMTKMACDQGMALEQRLAAALVATRRFELTPVGALVLRGVDGVVARFERRE